MTLELHEPAGATPLTPDELLGLKAKHIATRGELNELEGENIIAGLTWLDRRPKSFDLLTDAAVREIHKRLFGEIWNWAGVYRLTDKNIGVPVWHISTELRTCLDDARYQDAARQMITWLHEEAASMNDPHARRLLNGAAFLLGVKSNSPEVMRALELRGLHGSPKTS